MKRHVIFRAGAVFLMGTAFFYRTAGAIEVLDAAFMVESYVTFDCASERPPTGMAFDPGGTLYVIHTKTKEGRDGSIYRIDSDLNVTQWITGLSRPLDIIWAGGTNYGEYLYILEGYKNSTWSSGGVTRISLEGNVKPFSGSGLNQPTALGVDRTGNYDNFMFVGNGAWDNMEKVLLNGQVQSFSEFPYNISGSPSEIDFDVDGNYGGLMYVGIYTTTHSPWRGLNTLDAGGNPTRFAPDIINADGLEFDTTGEQYFGGYLYVVGATETEPSWAVYRVFPDGEVEKFVSDLKGVINLTFGPDGFLYVLESTWGTKAATISRIIPWDPVLDRLKESVGQKEEAQELVDQALVKEKEVLDLLEEMLAGVDPCEVQYRDIHQAKVKIQLSILQERSVQHHLNKSIGRLKGAWMILSGKDEYRGILGRIKESEIRRADINGDGVVDGRDFAILSRYWLKKYDR